MNEFKKFVLRGNAVDLAVGIVIGAGFGAVVNSLVKDLLTPLISAVGGQPNFSRLQITIGHSALTYGNFINALISFLVLAVVIFLFVVKPMNALTTRMNRGKEKTSDQRPCPQCLSMIPNKAKRCAHCTASITPTA